MANKNPSPVHYRKCSICEAMCGLVIEHQNGKVKSIHGNPKDTFSRGYHCIKGEALADLQEDPNRLRQPILKTASGWENVSWDAAFAEVERGIRSVQKSHGKNSLAVYLGNPNVHNYGSILFGLDFIKTLQTKNRYSATSIDQLPHQMVGYLMFGHQLLVPVPDVDRTHFMLILGGNPVVSRGSIMSAPDIGNRLKEIKGRGDKLVVIDPRRTETSALANEHHFIHPGSDAALLAALIHVIFSEDLEKPGRLLNHSEGYDTLRESFLGISVSAAAHATGISEDKIVRLAREFSSAKSAVCYGRVGVSTQQFGATCQWLITLLNFITGNLDSAGGAMFTRPAFDILPFAPRGHFNRFQSRVRGLPEFGGELPVATLADEMLTSGPDQVKGFITVAGNPVLSTPNGKRLEQALSQLEFMVSIDFYLNETTRHAKVILPPTPPLEHDHFDIIFNVLSVRNTAAFSKALFNPPRDAKHDWQIMLEIDTRLRSSGFLSALKAKVRRWFLLKLKPSGLLAWGLRFGPYKISLRRLKANFNGLDFGALKPELPSRLKNKTKRIDLMPNVYRDDLRRVKDVLLSNPRNDSQLLLIGRRSLRSNNSWFHNFERTTKGKSMCTALMHPVDAGKRGLVSDDVVCVSSRVGSIEISVVVTDTIMEGVISIPHGYGHHRAGTKLDNAGRRPGVSVNDITDQNFIDELSGNAAVNGVLVDVTKRIPN
jgi:anaerobic selenocysteine-containing dehydrogenase